MATKQIDGVSSVTSTSTINNGGVVRMNGATTSDLVRSQSTPTERVGVFGSTVLDNDSADKALSSGEFAYNNESPVAKKVTSSLAGESNTFLLSGASDPSNVRSIHKLEVVRTRRLTTALRENRFNEVTGEFDSGYPVVAVDNFYDISTDSLVAGSTDNAAAPTRNVPGELVYKTGAPNPVTDNYKAKTN